MGEDKHDENDSFPDVLEKLTEISWENSEYYEDEGDYDED